MEENELNYDAQHHVDLFQGDTVFPSDDLLCLIGEIIDAVVVKVPNTSFATSLNLRQVSLDFDCRLSAPYEMIAKPRPA